MNQNRHNPPLVCDRCKKQLKSYECNVCDGKGYFRKWIIFKNECEVCSGSGRVLRCPDEYQHILEDLKLSRELRTKSLYKNFRTPVLPKNPFIQAGQRTITKRAPSQQIPPPWHPSYPNPWHPMHPRNPRNQPFNPQNPNSLINPNNPMNPNNLLNRKPFK